VYTRRIRYRAVARTLTPALNPVLNRATWGTNTIVRGAIVRALTLGTLGSTPAPSARRSPPADAATHTGTTAGSAACSRGSVAGARRHGGRGGREAQQQVLLLTQQQQRRRHLLQQRQCHPQQRVPRATELKAEHGLHESPLRRTDAGEESGEPLRGVQFGRVVQGHEVRVQGGAVDRELQVELADEAGEERRAPLVEAGSVLLEQQVREKGEGARRVLAGYEELGAHARQRLRVAAPHERSRCVEQPREAAQLDCGAHRGVRCGGPAACYGGAVAGARLCLHLHGGGCSRAAGVVHSSRDGCDAPAHVHVDHPRIVSHAIRRLGRHLPCLE
jgi:hypothetical protein